MSTRDQSRYSKAKQAVFDLDCHYAGPCLICGSSDKRHRMYNAVRSLIEAGESNWSIAHNLGVFQRYVEAVRGMLR